MNRKDLIDILEESIYVCDIETHELLFANTSCQQTAGCQNYRGRKCYEVLQGESAPCPFCTNSRLTTHQFYHWEFTNPKLGRHFLLKDILIEFEGRPARLEIALDITERETLSRFTARKLKTEQALVDCIRSLTLGDGLDEAISEVLGRIGRYYGADRVDILELDPGRSAVGVTFEWRLPGIPPQDSAGRSVPPDVLPFWESAAQRHETLFLRDAADVCDSFPAVCAWMERLGIRSLTAVPFLVRGSCPGFIGVCNPSYNAGDAELLESLSYFIITELQKRRLAQQLAYNSTHDPLTGLFNRLQLRQFIDSAPVVTSAGAAFCDINGLKAINDLHGHSAGDAAILHTAGCLSRCFPRARVYRLSGDEFLALRINVAREEFEEKMQTARERLADEAGVSAGFIWESGNVDLNRLVRRADALMYEEKRRYYRERSR